MQRLVKLSLRNLGIRKGRTVLTLLGIALGVAMMVAVGIVRESTARSLADMFDQAAGRADLSVTNAVAGIVSGAGFEASALEQVRAVQGVKAAAPLMQILTLPAVEMDEWVTSLAFGNLSGMVLYGLDPEASRTLGHYDLVAGADLTAAAEDSILLTERYAQEHQQSNEVHPVLAVQADDIETGRAVVGEKVRPALRRAPNTP